MPRPLRVLVAGAIYHVWCRGNRCGAIYTCASDRLQFLRRLETAVAVFEIEVISYCLMTTHVHLVIETQHPNLADVMHWLNGGYARWFNREYDHKGHLFERRYDAKLIRDDAQLQTTCRYVELNPVEAGVCEHPADWRWSSFRAVVGIDPPLPFLRPQRLLDTFGSEDTALARARYAAYVEDGLAALRIAQAAA